MLSIRISNRNWRVLLCILVCIAAGPLLHMSDNSTFFEAHFVHERFHQVDATPMTGIFYGFVAGSFWFFEIPVPSGSNLNRILPLRFDFKDCLNASLNWSSGYTCSTAAESDPSATRSPSFW